MIQTIPILTEKPAGRKKSLFPTYRSVRELRKSPTMRAKIMLTGHTGQADNPLVTARTDTPNSNRRRKTMRTLRKLLSDRVRLLRAFDTEVPGEDYWRSGIPEVYSALRYGIGRDQYVSFSQELEGRVSYARSAADRHDNARRIRTTFARYVRRQLRLDETVISDETLQSLASRIMGHCQCGSGFVEIVRGQDIV